MRKSRREVRGANGHGDHQAGSSVRLRDALFDADQGDRVMQMTRSLIGRSTAGCEPGLHHAHGSGWPGVGRERSLEDSQRARSTRGRLRRDAVGWNADLIFAHVRFLRGDQDAGVRRQAGKHYATNTALGEQQ